MAPEPTPQPTDPTDPTPTAAERAAAVRATNAPGDEIDSADRAYIESGRRTVGYALVDDVAYAIADARADACRRGVEEAKRLSLELETVQITVKTAMELAEVRAQKRDDFLNGINWIAKSVGVDGDPADPETRLRIVQAFIDQRARTSQMHRRAQRAEGAEARLVALRQSHEREMQRVRADHGAEIVRLENEVRQLRARLGETSMTVDARAARLDEIANRIDEWGALTSEKCGPVNAPHIAAMLRLGAATARGLAVERDTAQARAKFVKRAATDMAEAGDALSAYASCYEDESPDVHDGLLRWRGAVGAYHEQREADEAGCVWGVWWLGSKRDGIKGAWCVGAGRDGPVSYADCLAWLEAPNTAPGEGFEIRRWESKS